MASQKMSLKKGSNISVDGEQLRLTKPLIVHYQSKGTVVAEAEAKGEHVSDDVQAVDKATICKIIQQKMNALEQEENDALCNIYEDDVLFSLPDAPVFEKGTSLSEQVSRTTAIITLKEILKTIKNL